MTFNCFPVNFDIGEQPKFATKYPLSAFDRLIKLFILGQTFSSLNIIFANTGNNFTQHWSQCLKTKHTRFIFREGWHLQKWWFFGKVPNGLWPPPSFSENHVSRQNCDKSATKVRMLIMAGLLCIIWSYLPWDACSTTVQHGNWLKTYPKKTLLYHFHAEKALFKGPKSAI